MGKAKNPTTISGHFKIDRKTLDRIGVLDATLAIDTKLFIDPMLLAKSKHREFNEDAVVLYQEHFSKIAALLEKSKYVGDAGWKGALKLFDYPEVAGTCLGYGAGSIRGSGWGMKLRTRTLAVASEIVAIGVSDPDLFPAMAIFEKDIGPDRLSDMVANVALPAIEKFNARVLRQLKLKGEAFRIRGANYVFLRNPFELKPTPLILVPKDVLRDLPIAEDWDGVVEAIEHNEELRDSVNEHIASIWEKKTKRDKEKLKEQATQNKEAFESLLQAMRGVARRSYDSDRDPLGLIKWAALGKQFAEENPLPKTIKTPKSLDDVHGVVREIVTQFRHLIENSGLNKELYAEPKKPRHESSVQRLFFAVAYSYCKTNNVDISPEIDTGNGKIDFKFSVGFEVRVLVEIKLSTNQNVVAGYTKQLDEYKKSQQTMRAIYLLVDVGKMGKKDQDLLSVKNARAKKKLPVSDLEFVNGQILPPPSKRR